MKNKKSLQVPTLLKRTGQEKTKQERARDITNIEKKQKKVTERERESDQKR